MISDALNLVIQNQLTGLRLAKFKRDPLNTPPDVAVWSSAQKRHGKIIEAAIAAALRSGGYKIWDEKKYLVPATADYVVRSQNDHTKTARTSLPYGENGRSLQIDLMTYSPTLQRIAAYEVKRGNGYNDSQASGTINRNILGVRTLLASYGELRGLIVKETIAKVISYYGASRVLRSELLLGDQLDDHFGCPVKATVDEATDYYAAQVHQYVRYNFDRSDTLLRPKIRELMEGFRRREWMTNENKHEVEP